MDVQLRIRREDGRDLPLLVWRFATPIRAAAPHDPSPAALVGTINVVVVVPERLSDAALVNAVATATEAKAQALHDLGHDATGTATDAVCILCPDEGRPHDFGGPRSLW